MDTGDQQILSEREVSSWLGVSEPTLFRLRRDGTGPKFVQLSERRIGYRKSAVLHWLEKRTVSHVGGVNSTAQAAAEPRNANGSVA